MSVLQPTVRSFKVLDDLQDRHNIPLVTEATIDAFVMPAAGEAAHCLLFFTGNPAERMETTDVAVVLPELVKVFSGHLRAAVVDRKAEEALRKRFHVMVAPSLVVTRNGAPVRVLPKIRDWSEYMEAIEAALSPDAPELVANTGPRTEINFTGKGA